MRCKLAESCVKARILVAVVKRLIINLSAAAAAEGAPLRIAQSGRAKSLRLQPATACQAFHRVTSQV